jgi:hypothetical protein
MYYTIVGIVLFLVGLAFGFVWPNRSWRWGLWITSPLIILIALKKGEYNHSLFEKR